MLNPLTFYEHLTNAPNNHRGHANVAKMLPDMMVAERHFIASQV